MTRVLVVGSVNLDLVVTVPHLPAPGETVLGSDVAFRPGGKGANQAVAARRLGADATLVALTGSDPFGADVRASLRREGLDLTHLGVVEGVPTGVALIVVRPDGENAITVAPGANRCLAGDRLAGLPAAAGDADLLLLQLEVPVPASLAAARAARAAGVPVVLNAAPPPAAADGAFQELLGSVDVLVVNESEALALAGWPRPVTAGRWLEVARELRALGPETVVVTLGEQGAVAVAEGVAAAQPAFPVAVVDSTGAGDAFCAGLAVCLAERLPVGAAVRFGCAAGALATTRVGAQAALPTRAQVEQLLATPPGTAKEGA
ncbi:MAG TPA: ribokinase [Thermaerobacter sp.]